MSGRNKSKTKPTGNDYKEVLKKAKAFYRDITRENDYGGCFIIVPMHGDNKNYWYTEYYDTFYPHAIPRKPLKEGTRIYEFNLKIKKWEEITTRNGANTNGTEYK